MLRLKSSCKLLKTHLPLKFQFSSIQKPENKTQVKTKANMKQQYKKIWQICKPQLPKYMLNSVLTIAHAAIFMYLPSIYGDLSHLMQLKLSTVPASEIISQYLTMTAKWSILFGLMGILTYRRRYEFLDISNRISVRLRSVLYKQILQRDFYKNSEIPQTFVHHLITDIKTVSEFTGEAIFMGLRGICFLAGGTACLLYTSPYISLIAIGIMTLFNLKFRGRNQTLKNLKEKENSLLVNLSQFASERFHNMKLIKISNTQVVQNFKISKELKSFYQYSKKVSEANGINYGSLEGFGLFSLFAVAATGSFLISMEVTNFSLIASSTYAMYVAMGFRSLINFNTQLMKISGVYSNIQKRMGDLTKNQDYFLPFSPENIQKQQQKIKQLFQQKIKNEKDSKGVSIIIKNLNFTHMYQDSHHKVQAHLYKNFTLQIKTGQAIALVGESGTGKSTLFNLITKLAQPSSGQIFIDDKSLQNLSFEDMQKIVSYVTQQTFLFAGTFYDNICYGNHGFDLSQQHIEQCLKKVNAYDFVQQKGGIKGRIQQKGNNLSGGQKQRIILARAMIKQPKLLLLDESTSGIDSQSQRHIINGLQNLKRNGTTIIIITHKLEPFKRIIDKTIEMRVNDDEDIEIQKDLLISKKIKNKNN